MSVNNATFILQNTNDGDDLSPNELNFLQYCVNAQKDEDLLEIVEIIKNGSFIPFHERWAFGVEGLTLKADNGYWVNWRGINIEHYSGKKLKEFCMYFARTMRWLEYHEKEISIANWHEYAHLFRPNNIYKDD